MPFPSARRLLAGLVVVATVVAVSGGPAVAAADDPGVTLFAADGTVAIGASGLPLEVVFGARTQVTINRPTVTYEVRGAVTGLSLVAENPSDCQAESATRLVCTDPFRFIIPAGGVTGELPARIVADATAASGASAVVTTTFSAPGLAAIVATSRVRTADRVDLVAGAESQVSVAPGDAFAATLAVRNAGDRTADGVSVTFGNDYSFSSPARYRNCRYVGDRIRSCTFDQPLLAGTAYQASMPYRLRPDTAAPGSGFGEMKWLTTAELEDLDTLLVHFGDAIGTPGDGDVLTLQPAPSAARALQADPDASDNFSSVSLTVTGTNGVDLAAVGGQVDGAVGAGVTATIGVRNSGPATLDRNRVGEPASVTSFYTPAGTTVVTVPDACRQVVNGRVDFDHPGRPGFAKYWCFSSELLVAGESETYRFGLQIDAIVPGAKGVVVVNEPCECSVFDKDVDLTNNTGYVQVAAHGPAVGIREAARAAARTAAAQAAARAAARAVRPVGRR